MQPTHPTPNIVFCKQARPGATLGLRAARVPNLEEVVPFARLNVMTKSLNCSHATGPLSRVHPSRFFHKRSTTLSPRPCHSRTTSFLSGSHFKGIGMCSVDCRWCRRSHSHARALGPDDHAG